MPDRGEDEAVLEAMLLTAAEEGYGRATVREVCARARISENRFHARFASKEACFSRAYAEAAERLGHEIETACAAAPEWRAGFRAGLGELLRTAAEQPLLAKALLIEVRAARGEAWTTHQEMVARAVAALESVREQPGARPDSSPMTTGFVIGAIEETLAIELATGRPIDTDRLLADLTRLAFLQLFGEE